MALSGAHDCRVIYEIHVAIENQTRDYSLDSKNRPFKINERKQATPSEQASLTNRTIVKSDQTKNDLRQTSSK